MRSALFSVCRGWTAKGVNTSIMYQRRHNRQRSPWTPQFACREIESTPGVCLHAQKQLKGHPSVFTVYQRGKQTKGRKSRKTSHGYHDLHYVDFEVRRIHGSQYGRAERRAAWFLEFAATPFLSYSPRTISALLVWNESQVEARGSAAQTSAIISTVVDECMFIMFELMLVKITCSHGLK